VFEVVGYSHATLKNLPPIPARSSPTPAAGSNTTLSVAKTCLWLTDAIAVTPELTSAAEPRPGSRGGRAARHRPGGGTHAQLPGQPTYHTIPAGSSSHLFARRTSSRSRRTIPDLNPELLTLLEHVVLFAPELAEWVRPVAGHPRSPHPAPRRRLDAKLKCTSAA